MIERLLAGEAALARDELDAADRLFQQVVEADPRNAMAIVGRARVAERRGDHARARTLAEGALAIDPDEAAAARLLAELTPAEAPTRGVDVPPLAPPRAPQRAPRVAGARTRGGWRGLVDRLLRRR